LFFFFSWGEQVVVADCHNLSLHIRNDGAKMVQRPPALPSSRQRQAKKKKEEKEKKKKEE
jgi:hypothetical protein